MVPNGIDPHLINNKAYDLGYNYPHESEAVMFDTEGSVTFQPEGGLMLPEVAIMYLVLSTSILFAFIIFSFFCARKIIRLTSDNTDTPEFFNQETVKLLTLRKECLQLQAQLAGLSSDDNKPPQFSSLNGGTLPIETVLCEHNSGRHIQPTATRQTAHFLSSNQAILCKINERLPFEQHGRVHPIIAMKAHPNFQKQLAPLKKQTCPVVVGNKTAEYENCKPVETISFVRDDNSSHSLCYQSKSTMSVYENYPQQNSNVGISNSAKSSPRQMRKLPAAVLKLPTSRSALSSHRRAHSFSVKFADNSDNNNNNNTNGTLPKLNFHEAVGLPLRHCQDPCCNNSVDSSTSSLPRNYQPRRDWKANTGSNESLEIQLRRLIKEMNRNNTTAKKSVPSMTTATLLSSS